MRIQALDRLLPGLRVSSLLLLAGLGSSAAGFAQVPATVEHPTSQWDRPHGGAIAYAAWPLLTEADPFHPTGILNTAATLSETLPGREDRRVRAAQRAIDLPGSYAATGRGCDAASSRARAVERSCLEFASTLAAVRAGLLSCSGTAPPPPLS